MNLSRTATVSPSSAHASPRPTNPFFIRKKKKKKKNVACLPNVAVPRHRVAPSASCLVQLLGPVDKQTSERLPRCQQISEPPFGSESSDVYETERASPPRPTSSADSYPIPGSRADPGNYSGHTPGESGIEGRHFLIAVFDVPPGRFKFAAATALLAPSDTCSRKWWSNSRAPSLECWWFSSCRAEM